MDRHIERSILDSLIIRPLDWLTPINSGDLDWLESKIGATLPQDYKEFLLVHNGGIPVQRTFRVDAFDVDEAEIIFFFGVGKKTKHGSNPWEWKQSEDWRPECLFPIAGAEKVHTVTVGVAEWCRGLVFVDRLVLMPPPDRLRSLDSLTPANGLARIADSFTDFLRLLH